MGAYCPIICFAVIITAVFEPYQLGTSSLLTSVMACHRGLLYCMEYLEENLDEWLGEELEVDYKTCKFCSDCSGCNVMMHNDACIMLPSSCSSWHSTRYHIDVLYSACHAAVAAMHWIGQYTSAPYRHTGSQQNFESGMLNWMMSTAEMHKACNNCQVPDAAIAGLR